MGPIVFPCSYKAWPEILERNKIVFFKKYCRQDNMYPLSRLRDIRSLELFLFGGVPETAEQMYERDSHPYTDIRTTRRGVSMGKNPRQQDGIIVERVKINLKTGETCFEDVPLLEKVDE